MPTSSINKVAKQKVWTSPMGVIYAAFIIALLVGLTFLVRWMLADIAINTVKRNIESWDAMGGVSSLADWQLTNSELSKALHYNPDQADYHYLQGLLYEWRGFIVSSPALTPAEQTEIRYKSISAYREATRLRPTWPETWAYLARQKAYQQEFDDELIFALDKALTLGEGEPRVQLLATDVIAQAWPFSTNDVDIRVKSLANIEQGLNVIHVREVRQHLSFLDSRDLLPTICPLLNLDSANYLASSACRKAAVAEFPL